VVYVERRDESNAEIVLIRANRLCGPPRRRRRWRLHILFERMILRTDIPDRRWHRRRGTGQILERRHVLMEVHHGNAVPGESAPG
jgi:hypothetical protein